MGPASPFYCSATPGAILVILDRRLVPQDQAHKLVGRKPFFPLGLVGFPISLMLALMGSTLHLLAKLVYGVRLFISPAGPSI